MCLDQGSTEPSQSNIRQKSLWVLANNSSNYQTPIVYAQTCVKVQYIFESYEKFFQKVPKTDLVSK